MGATGFTSPSGIVSDSQAQVPQRIGVTSHALGLLSIRVAQRLGGSCEPEVRH